METTKNDLKKPNNQEEKRGAVVVNKTEVPHKTIWNKLNMSGRPLRDDAKLKTRQRGDCTKA
jgi:hypothetical protein